MNPQILAQAQNIASQVLSNVTADQLTNDTPCANWKVAQLIDHLVGSQHWSRSAIEGVDMDQTGEGSADGDYLQAFNDAAQAALDAFNADGAMDRTVNPGFGDMPAPALLGLAVTDTFTHAWDVAKATGQDTNLDAQLADQLLAASRQMIQPAFRSEEGNIFGPEKQAPEGASAADQLAAFLGREV